MLPPSARRERWLKVAVALMLVGLALTTVDIVWAFTKSPMVNGAELSTLAEGQVYTVNGQIVTNVQLFSQKIFYLHVPVAVISMALVIVSAVYSVLYLVRKDPGFDLRSRTCMEVGFALILATMASGILWTRFEWGVWWVWEPRLTTYLILTLLVMAYFILRSAIDDPEKKARFASVFAIIAAIDAPISFMVTRLIPSSIHPVVFRTDSGLPPDMLIPFLCGLFGMIFIGAALYRLRLTIVEQSQEVELLKERFEHISQR